MRNSVGRPQRAYTSSQCAIFSGSGSVDPKCALTLRARLAEPGDTRSSQPS